MSVAVRLGIAGIRWSQLVQQQQDGGNETSFEEIAESDPKNIADEIHERAQGPVGDLVNEDPVAALIANTNASGWFLDELDIDQSSIEVSNAEIRCSANAQFGGDQDQDSGPAGTIISGTLTIILLPDLSIQLEDQEFEIESPFGDDEDDRVWL